MECEGCKKASSWLQLRAGHASCRLRALQGRQLRGGSLSSPVASHPLHMAKVEKVSAMEELPMILNQNGTAAELENNFNVSGIGK